MMILKLLFHQYKEGHLLLKGTSLSGFGLTLGSGLGARQV